MLIRPLVIKDYEDLDHVRHALESHIDLMYNKAVLERRDSVIHKVFDFNPNLYSKEIVVFLFSFIQKDAPSIHIPMPVSKVLLGDEDVVGILNFFSQEIKRQSPLLGSLDIFITVSFSVSVDELESEDLTWASVLVNSDCVGSVSSLHNVKVGASVNSYLANHQENDSRLPIVEVNPIDWDFDEYSEDYLDLSGGIVSVSKAYFASLKQCDAEHKDDLLYPIDKSRNIQ